MRRAKRVSGVALLVVVAMLTAGAIAGLRTPRGASPDGDAVRSRPAADVRVPLAFVENRGQADPRVRYYAQGNRFAFYLTPDQVMLAFAKEQEARGLALALRFVGRNPASAPEGAARAPGVVNDLRGDDPAAWRTQIPRFGDVVYRELWPGIDLRLYEQASVLKYEFRVRPGARPSDIRLAYAGADGLALEPSGALRISTALGALRDSAPVSYQEIAGRRVPVQSRYVLGDRVGDARRFSFAAGGYRRDRELIIDPGIQYTTFLGGASHEIGAGIAVDAAGNSYVTGTTQSPNFPTTAGAFRRTGAASNFSDVFVSKLNPAGTALVYSTFIGGSDFDFGRRIAIDAAGNAYVTGQTKSSNFPTTGGAFDRSFNIPGNCPRCGIDNYDAFVAKLNAAGSALVYSTFLGGTDIDDARGIAVDGAGSAYVTGETLSGDFPTTAAAFSRTRRGAYDVFVTKLNAGGTALAYSTYLGGTQVDNGERVAVDAGGSAYVVGFTSSADFPTTAGAFDTTANGAFDASVTKLNPAGSALVYSTYLGGQGFDDGSGLAVDAAGSAYVTGGTGSTDFPTTAGAFDRTGDGSDGFVTKLNAGGSAAVYSTLVGGSDGDAIGGIVLDAARDAWLTGATSSADFPVTADAADASFNGVSDAVIAELSADGSTLRYATYLGGTQSEAGNDVARDGGGDVYVTGHTYSMDFPATVGAFDRIFNGDLLIFWGDAFVTKVDVDAQTSTPPAPPAVPGAPGLLSPANGEAAPQPITFDWSDVPSAASYTIQIDDSSGFGAPLVRAQSVTTSVYATTGLASTTHFWRVRGVNSAGVAGAWSAVRSFTPGEPPPPATLGSLDTNPSTVAGGEPSFGTVVLSVGAPHGGALVSLSSSNPAVASVPGTVTVAANDFTGGFTIATAPVSSSTTVVITATYNGSTRTASLTVTSGQAPAAGLQSAVVSPSSVTGGTGAQGVVFLSGAAPPGGVTVSLSSGAPGVASVPASVTVVAGSTTGVFPIATSAVAAETAVTISATLGGTTRSATLTVNPPAPPPQTATLTVNATGRSGERVTSTPAGINVSTGTSGSASFDAGTSITLRVTNGRDAIWSGACSSGGQKRKTCTFTLASSGTVTANVQ